VLSQLYWIDGPWSGRVAVAARPRGGDWLEDEVKSWRDAGLNIVVSLLTPDETEELGVQREEEYCREIGIRFFQFPIVDRSVPPPRANTLQLIAQLDTALAGGNKVVVHCRQGIGRSGLIAAGLLVARGLNPAAAMERASVARGVPVPETPEQSAWITDFAEALTAAGHVRRG
jgi:protein-tyrosine phosphatase